MTTMEKERFDRYTLKELIKTSADKRITVSALLDLGFQEVLKNRWLWLADPVDRSLGEVYVTFTQDGDCYIEGRSMNGESRYGNHFVGVSADLERLLMIVELLDI